MTEHPSTARITLLARLRYWFDGLMARGPMAVTLFMLMWLVVVWVVGGAVILEFALLPNTPNLFEAAWAAMQRSMSPRGFAGDTGWARLVSFLIYMAGFVFASALIGLLTTGFRNKSDKLRRGRSPVIEQDHTIILGWSARALAIISELGLANASGSGRIVVLSAEDKPALEEQIAAEVATLSTTKVVVRTGDPRKETDLAITRPRDARSIIVLAPSDDASGDAFVATVVLNVLTTLQDRELPIIAEVSDRETANEVRVASGGRVRVVRSAQVIAQVVAQACRQPGLGSVARELLSFAGDEVYFVDVPPELAGATFADALFAYERCSVIGVAGREGRSEVNPRHDRLLHLGEQLILIALDDSAIQLTGGTPVPAPAAPSAVPGEAIRNGLLLVGWNELAPLLLAELDPFVARGTTVDVFVDPDLCDTPTLPVLEHIKISVYELPGMIEDLASFIAEADHDVRVMVGYGGGVDADTADSRTLLTLLLLQRIGGARGHRPTIAELRQSRYQKLAQSVGADDFIVSDSLSSHLMAQLAEDPRLEAVLGDLFDVEGDAIGVHDIGAYVTPGGSPTFAELVASAQRQGEIAIGWVRRPTSSGRPEVALNPPKSERTTLAPGDGLVVVGPRRPAIVGPEALVAAAAVPHPAEDPGWVSPTNGGGYSSSSAAARSAIRSGS